jgi:hypothetical protein
MYLITLVQGKPHKIPPRRDMAHALISFSRQKNDSHDWLTDEGHNKADFLHQLS